MNISKKENNCLIRVYIKLCLYALNLYIFIIARVRMDQLALNDNNQLNTSSFSVKV